VLGSISSLKEQPGAGTAAQGAVPVHGGVQSCGDVALRGGQWAQVGWGSQTAFPA